MFVFLFVCIFVALLVRYHVQVLEFVCDLITINPVESLVDYFNHLISTIRLKAVIKQRRINIRRNLPRRCGALLNAIHDADSIIDREDILDRHASFAVAEGLRVRYQLLNPNASNDNRRIVTDRLVKDWEKRGIRPSHISKALPLAVEVALSRTEAEEEAIYCRKFLTQVEARAK